MTWQAHGALQILSAAYAATYRQMLAINHQLEAYRRPGHDLRTSQRESGASGANLAGGMRQGAGAATREEARDDQGWPFSADPISLYQGRIAHLRCTKTVIGRC